MAMAIPSPSSSDDSSLPPATPTIQSDVPAAVASATAQAPASAAGAANAAMKRKPSRRANTAERRATHNAVERQRRETLNGRFLDLASLLPNLSQIRRPSKSSIVNSSIAHIHASRRHRMMASRELRALKMESDALRRELNEWRDRAGIPRLEEPVRSDSFSIVLSGELEVLVVNGVGPEDEDDELVGPAGAQYAPGMQYEDEMYEVEDPRMVMLHQAPPAPPIQHRPSISIHPAAAAPGAPIIASPTTMSFENPVMGMYNNESHIQPPYPTATTNGYPDKVAHWNMYQQQQQQQQQQIMLQQQQQAHHRNSISHGHPHPHPHAHHPHGHQPDQAYLASLRQGRERSSSIASYHSTGTTAGTGSPQHAPSLTLSSASGGGSSASSSGSASPASHQYEVYDGQAGWMMPAPKQGSPTVQVPAAVGGPGNAVAAYAMMM